MLGLKHRKLIHRVNQSKKQSSRHIFFSFSNRELGTIAKKFTDLHLTLREDHMTFEGIIGAEKKIEK